MSWSGGHHMPPSWSMQVLVTDGWGPIHHHLSTWLYTATGKPQWPGFTATMKPLTWLYTVTMKPPLTWLLHCHTEATLTWLLHCHTEATIDLVLYCHNEATIDLVLHCHPLPHWSHHWPDFVLSKLLSQVKLSCESITRAAHYFGLITLSLLMANSKVV